MIAIKWLSDGVLFLGSVLCVVVVLAMAGMSFLIIAIINKMVDGMFSFGLRSLFRKNG